MMKQIVQRYYAKEMTASFLLFLSLIFGLYVLVDYTSRAASFEFTSSELAQYYLLTFIARIDILAPFALLVAVIKTLCQANMRNELVALRASGLSPAVALSPLLVLALVATGLIYVNEQFAIPEALRWVDKMESRHSAPQPEGNRVRHLALRDGSQLLFRTYYRDKQEFGDSYWLKSMDEVIRMQRLNIQEPVPSAFFVERFKRNIDNQLILVDNQEHTRLPELVFDEQELLHTVTPSIEQSLTQLWQRLPRYRQARIAEDSGVEAAFWKKTMLPWLCLIAALAPAPLCIAHRKPLRVFYLFAGSLFGLFALYILISAGYTLANHGAVPAWLALALPTGSTAIVAIKNFLHMR